MPAGNTVPVLWPRTNSTITTLNFIAVIESFCFDFVVRRRLGYLDITKFVLQELPLPRNLLHNNLIALFSACLSFSSPLFDDKWLLLRHYLPHISNNRRAFTISLHERLRLRCILDAIIPLLFGLHYDDMKYILSACDLPKQFIANRANKVNLNPKGFWRVDKNKDPEMRHSILTLIAVYDLQNKISDFNGDYLKGIEAFCKQNDGKGWMIPETLRLTDYGLGHDNRAKQHQPVASRLGPRFYDWQLEQDPEESWRECELHARNILGEEGFQNLLDDIKSEKSGEPRHSALPSSSESNKIIKTQKKWF